MRQSIPIFKSTFSIGKSILTLDDPSEDTYPIGPKSILSIVKEADLKELVLVEDTFYSFYKAYRYCLKNDIKLIYGVTFQFLETRPAEGEKPLPCKIVVLMKNQEAYADLIKLNTIASSKDFLSPEDLEKFMTPNLILAIPFYDSFVHLNALNFGKFSDFLMKFKPLFFLESNGLPFDPLIINAVSSLNPPPESLVRGKTILYYKNSDVEALLTYRCICSRSFSKRTLSKPNFDHFASDQFSWESYKNVF
jgi:DNA polymerase III alpha subunit